MKYFICIILLFSLFVVYAQPTKDNSDITASGCTVTFPNNYDDQVTLSFLSTISGYNCPGGDLILANLNDKNGNSSVTFDTNITFNSITFNFSSGNNPLEIIIPVGVTLNVTNDLEMNLSSAVQDKFLTVEGSLVVGGTLDFGGIDLEIDGTGSISADNIIGADDTSCTNGENGGTGTCPTITTNSCDDGGTGTFCNDSALPIELALFDARANKSAVEVKWVTSTEINNDFFTLEKSTDGINYSKIAIISGAGNSSERIEYSFKDRNPIFGRSYYRLKQTDYDGTSETFSPASVEFTSLSNGRLYFNNPVSNGEEVTLFTEADSDEELEIVVFNMIGEYILRDSFTGGSYSFVLDADVKQGIYFVRVNSINTQKTGRLVVQ